MTRDVPKGHRSVHPAASRNRPPAVLAPWVLLLAAAIAGGCSSVTTARPIGSALPAEDHAALEGIWSGPEGALFVKAAGDELVVASLEWEDREQRFRVVSFRAQVSESRGARWLNAQEPADPDGGDRTALRWSFVRLLEGSDDGTLVLVPPDVDAFASAVDDGVLQGEIEARRHSTTVHLSSPREDIEAFLDPARIGSRFHVDSPTVLRRLGDLD